MFGSTQVIKNDKNKFLVIPNKKKVVDPLPESNYIVINFLT
jgi:hypothetical protein